MPVQPADLLAPVGVVEPTLFPGEDSTALTARLQAYIDEAEAVTSVDDAVRAWAYHRAFYAAYLRMSSQPASNTFADQGGNSFLMSQINAMLEQSEKWRLRYEGIVAPDAGTAGGTHSVRTPFTW